MLVVIFYALVAVLATLGTICLRKGHQEGVVKSTREGYEALSAVCFFIGICVLIPTVILSLTMPMGNLKRAAHYEAFYYSNAQNYATAVQKTEDVLTVSIEKFEASLIPIEGSIEKWEQGKEVSQRILEWRDAVNSYNRSITSMRAYDGNWVFGILYPTLSEELKTIAIE